jgi:chloride channel 2
MRNILLNNLFGAGLSVGSEGPLVHVAACIAYLLMSFVSEFGDILQSPNLCKQVLAASAAVGVSSAFNAPLGGMLFSIEVTSTFYLVSNYWKSFFAAVAGSVACHIFLISKGATVYTPHLLQMQVVNYPYEKWELAMFLCMGVVFGYAAHVYLVLSQQVNISYRGASGRR